MQRSSCFRKEATRLALESCWRKMRCTSKLPGAEVIVLCANTVHVVAPAIEAAVTVPFLHLADAAAQEVKYSDLTAVGSLGTRYTMEQNSYRGRLEHHGLEVIALMNLIELLSTRLFIPNWFRVLLALHPKGIVAGCTEIELLIQPTDIDLIYFTTATIPGDAAADFALTEMHR